MTRIGVVADTHLTGADEDLTRIVDTYLSDADFFIHAGDLIDMSVLRSFNGKTVHAVAGNMDLPGVRRMLPERLILTVGDYRIGVIHGWGPPFDLEERLLQKIGEVDCLVYGHTHRPACRKAGDVLLFNPGSALDKRFCTFNTIGLLDIGDGISGTIIELPEGSSMKG